MRKSIAETGDAKRPFTAVVLQELKDQGYKFVLVKGVTLDKRYDFIELHHIVLIPLKDLSTDQSQMDIYEPIDSEILLQWSTETDGSTKIYVA